MKIKLFLLGVIFSIIVLILLTGLLTGCSINKSYVDQNKSYKNNSKIVEEDNYTIKENYTIKLADDKIDADKIVVKKGVEINLEIINLNDNRERIFEIKDFNISEIIPVGRAIKISFTPNKKGEFEYGFRNSKVKGLIIVE